MDRLKNVSEKTPAETMEDVLRAWVQCATTIPRQEIDTIEKLNAVMAANHRYGIRVIELLAAAQAREGRDTLLWRRVHKVCQEGGRLREAELEAIADKRAGSNKKPNHRSKSWRTAFKRFSVAMAILAAKATGDKLESIVSTVMKSHNASRSYVFNVLAEIGELERGESR
jgi:hypothetical protein